MNASRLDRTALYRELGIFWCADVLGEQGIDHPAEQMMAICHFIARGLSEASGIPPLSNREEVEYWTHSRLTETAEYWKRGALSSETWPWLVLRSVVAIAWNPYREFSHLLRARCGKAAVDRAARRLKDRGFDVEWETVSELTDQFYRYRLPKAVRTFDPRQGAGHETGWLSTVFYRFALQELESDRLGQSHLALFLKSETSQHSPEETVVRKEHERLTEMLPHTLAKLGKKEQIALRLYFGLAGKEHTIGEIGQVLGVSAYKARTAIVHGLATLAAQLGIQGALDDAEFRFAKLLFREGMDPKVAASRLGLEKADIRDLRARIDEKFRRALRARTHRATPDPLGTGIKEEKKMVDAQSDLLPHKTPDEFEKWIRDTVLALRQPPALVKEDDGSLKFSLSGHRVSVGAVRETILRDPDLVDELSTRPTGLEWLSAPLDPIERADVLDDEAIKEELLEGLRQRRWVVAEALYDHCMDAAKRKIKIFDEPREYAVERIFRTLNGVAQAIEGALPRRLRREGSTYFRLSKHEDGQVVGVWDGEPEEQAFDIARLVRNQASTVGEIEQAAWPILAEQVVQGLLNGEFSLPGFRLIGDATGHSVSLLWLPPSLEDEMDAYTSEA